MLENQDLKNEDFFPETATVKRGDIKKYKRKKKRTSYFPQTSLHKFHENFRHVV